MKLNDPSVSGVFLLPFRVEEGLCLALPVIHNQRVFRVVVMETTARVRNVRTVFGSRVVPPTTEFVVVRLVGTATFQLKVESERVKLISQIGKHRTGGKDGMRLLKDLQ